MARYPLPKRVKANIKERARKQAQRQTRRLARQTERQVAKIQRQTDRRVRVTRNTYAREQQRLGSISLAGLRGRYRREAAQEIAATQRGLEHVLPRVTRSIRVQGRRKVAEARSALRDERQAAYQSALESLRSQARERLRERAEERAEERRKRLRDAIELAASRYRKVVEANIKAQQDGADEEDVPPIPVTMQQWRQFAEAIEDEYPLMPPALVAQAVAHVAASRSVNRALGRGPLPVGPSVLAPSPRNRRRMRNYLTDHYFRGIIP